MTTLLRESRPVARKEYECDAAEWYINSNLGRHDFEPEDWAIIEKASAERFKILPGLPYVRQSGIYEGELCTFKARIDMHGICLKYEIYEE
ncbi:MAG: hypothetical protein JKY26_06485 [Pseudomonas sp.]|nr:hypothetical protein [Pseudomonas sp.]